MEELLTSLFLPHNAVFVVPAVVAILFMAMQIVGAGFGDGGADHDHGGLDGAHVGEHGVDPGHVDVHDGGVGHVDGDVDGDVDVDGHVHVHGGHDHGHLHGHDHGHAHVGTGKDPLTAVLMWFNVGRAPLMVVLEILLLSLGLYGVVGSWALHQWSGIAGWNATALTAPAALAAAALTAKIASSFFARYLPTFETKHVTSRSLVGLTAEVASEEVNAESGRASAKDAAGDLYTVFCKMAPGSPPAKRGESVVLVAYAPDVDRYTVKPAAAAPQQAPAAKP